MSDFDRIEEARERNEGPYYDEYHERMSAEEPADQNEYVGDDDEEEEEEEDE